MWRLTPRLLLIPLFCGIIQVIADNGMSSEEDGLQCSNCTQLRHLPCTVHRYVDCTHLVHPQREGVILGKPIGVAARRYHRIYQSNNVDLTGTGINVTFHLPYGFYTPGLLEGFEIKLTFLNSPRTICHKMEFSQPNFTGSSLEQNMILFFDCIFQHPRPIYVISVTTVPKYEESSSEHIPAKNFEPAPDDANLPMTANRWQPSVTLVQVSSLCELKVTYDQGPEQYKYTRYNVTVYGSTSKTIKITDVLKQNGSLKGEYQVNVTTFVGKHSLFTATVQPRGHLIGKKSLYSNEVNLTGCSSVPPSEPKPDRAQCYTLSVICATVVCTIIISAILKHAVHRLRMRKKESKNLYFINKNNNLESLAHDSNNFDEIKDVLALYSYESNLHLRVVNRLCIYLQNQWNCSIWVYPDDHVDQKGWLALRLKKTDCVLIINSEGAFKYYKDIMTKSAKPVGLNRHDELFWEGITQLKNTNKKLFVACFSYTNYERVLPELCCYYISDNEFDYDTVAGGIELKRAIENAKVKYKDFNIQIDGLRNLDNNEIFQAEMSPKRYY